MSLGLDFFRWINAQLVDVLGVFYAASIVLGPILLAGRISDRWHNVESITPSQKASARNRTIALYLALQVLMVWFAINAHAIVSMPFRAAGE